MGIYKEQHFIKDKNGKWKKTKTQIVKVPHDLGRWQRNMELDKKSVFDDETLIQVDVTKGGLNKKVTRIVSKLGKNERVVRDLITTSSRMPRKAKEKYKNIVGCNEPIRR